MGTQVVTVARNYAREGEHSRAGIIRFLHDPEKVLGVKGLPVSARIKIRKASLLDLLLDLPLLVEFYDRPNRVAYVIDKLEAQMGGLPCCDLAGRRSP